MKNDLGDIPNSIVYSLGAFLKTQFWIPRDKLTLSPKPLLYMNSFLKTIWVFIFKVLSKMTNKASMNVTNDAFNTTEFEDPDKNIKILGCRK